MIDKHKYLSHIISSHYSSFLFSWAIKTDNAIFIVHHHLMLISHIKYLTMLIFLNSPQFMDMVTTVDLLTDMVVMLVMLVLLMDMEVMWVMLDLDMEATTPDLDTLVLATMGDTIKVVNRSVVCSDFSNSLTLPSNCQTNDFYYVFWEKLFLLLLLTI